MISEDEKLSVCVEEYCRAVSDARIPRAYRGILAALNLVKSTWETAHPADSVGALYQGYMDMSFIAFAPSELAGKRLKISLVFLHATGQFSLWLTAGNRTIQKSVSQSLRKISLGGYSLSVLEPGVDAIIAYDLPKPYLFDEPETLNRTLFAAAEAFASDMVSLVDKA